VLLLRALRVDDGRRLAGGLGAEPTVLQILNAIDYSPFFSISDHGNTNREGFSTEFVLPLSNRCITAFPSKMKTWSFQTQKSFL
jgi:hypothetical protein